MTVVEDAAELGVSGAALCDSAEDPERHGIDDVVADDRTRSAFPGCGRDVMAVVPIRERAAVLDVTEVSVPGEL